MESLPVRFTAKSPSYTGFYEALHDIPDLCKNRIQLLFIEPGTDLTVYSWTGTTHISGVAAKNILRWFLIYQVPLLVITNPMTQAYYVFSFSRQPLSSIHKRTKHRLLSLQDKENLEPNDVPGMRHDGSPSIHHFDNRQIHHLLECSHHIPPQILYLIVTRQIRLLS